MLYYSLSLSLSLSLVFKSVVLHSALVWGSSVKHNPQKVGKEHILNDEDVVQIVKK
jgi:ribosome-interacting GTPase 1